MMRKPLTLLTSVAVLLAACSGQSTLVGGDAVRWPDARSLVFTIQVLAGDDLTLLRAAVTVGSTSLLSGATGDVEVTWDQQWDHEPAAVVVSLSGFVSESLEISEIPESGTIEVRLEPVVLRGTVLTPDRRPLPAVSVRLGEVELQTDDRGGFTFIRAVPGSLDLSRPAWESATIAWDGEDAELELTLAPRMVRALRVSGPKAGDLESWQSLLSLADDSGINAFVVDIKDERGRVFHDTSVGLAHDIGAVTAGYDLDQVVADMNALGLYKISRIATFQDPLLAAFDSAITIRNGDTGGVWETNSGLAWLDPTDPGAWVYPLALAEEACRRGFDEVQFDYVSFPSDGPISELGFDDLEFSDYYSATSQEKRVGVIAAFLQSAHDLLNPLGCAVAANIFAIVLESSTDEGIGQMPQVLSSTVDVLSPMIYSFAYGAGWKGFSDPNEHAPEIVAQALDAGISLLDGFGIYRPWVQRAFLDAAEILTIQSEVEARQLGWMLWSATTDFDRDMLPAAEE
jgi:hypothetical protein